MTRHAYRVGILPWTLELLDGVLVVTTAFRTHRVPLARVTHMGIASTAYDAGMVGVPALWSAEALELRVGDERVTLPPGPAGLVLVYETEDGKKRDLAFTFKPDDAGAMRLLQSALDQIDPRAWRGVGDTLTLRASMGLGGGDFAAGLMLFLMLGIFVALLMWLGILS